MKSQRQEKILSIIQSHTITTQEELQSHLQEAGFHATQATISRDIKELRLVKALSSAGNYYYTTPVQKEPEATVLNIDFVFLESIRSVDFAGNFVVVKCYAGMANAVCVAVDTGTWDGLVGTIAGDDTIFLLLRTQRQAEEFAEFLRELVAKAKASRRQIGKD
ncbi:MAG: arginine repressor [Angelakisella sp.]|nr:arginine repressor [Angelakisella sp.]